MRKERMLHRPGRVCFLRQMFVPLFLLSSARPIRSFNAPIISPGTPIEGERAVISFAEHQTTEDRRAYLMTAQEQGYTCWMIPNYKLAAVCIQSSTSTYVDIPKSAETLRRTLAEVNLSAWLPSLLCPSPPQMNGGKSPDHGWRGGSKVDQSACYDAVEAALAAQEHVEVVLVWEGGGGTREDHRISATVDEAPWLKVLQSAVGMNPAHMVEASDCATASIALAFGRAKKQLRPALQSLVLHQNPSLPSPPVLSTERVQGLLTLLDSRNENETMEKASLRITSPRPQGRVSGGILPFIADLHLGLPSTTDSSTTPTAAKGHGSIRQGLTAKQGLDGDSDGSSGSSETSSGARSELTAPLSNFAECNVRVVVDGAIASTVSVDVTSATSGYNTIAVQTDVIPIYEQNSRCSEHPANAAIRGAAGGGAWDINEEVWRLHARAVDRVCTRDASGAHRVYSMLACRNDARDITVEKTDTMEEGDSTTRPEAATSAPQWRPVSEGSDWEVLATSATVEYFHTGILSNAVASSPSITEEAERQNRDDASETNSDRVVATSIFDSPPEELSVPLYLKGDPNKVVETVAVPRWLSDGEVWEAAFDACSNAFGPLQGVLVNTNDCVDLVTNAIAAKRVDLFNVISLRLGDHLRRANPAFVLEGHTGAMPEKVEALGAAARNGGPRVSRICEVGFNAGHSSLNWLLNSHPSTKVLAFDLGEHDYVKHALDFLQAVFPGRLEVIVGDSTSTIPAYADAEAAAGRDPRVCDVVFVDGAHTERGAFNDLTNFRALAKRGWNMLAIDDLEMLSVKTAWHRFNEDGGGMLERVVKGTGQHLSHAREGEDGNWDVRIDSGCHSSFIFQGHFALGLGRFNIA